MAEREFQVAVATTDGRKVDQHFGHTDTFAIYAIDSVTGASRLVEKRKLDQSGCSGEGCWGSEVFEKIADQLSDVEFVLAVKIGPHAASALSRRQIITLDVDVSVEEALGKVRDYHDRKKLMAERAQKILRENGIEDE